MKTIKTQIPRHHLRTFQFCANHFGVGADVLMQNELYAEATVFKDDAFWFLEMLDDNHTTEDLEPVTLAFANDAHALLVRISQLLRRQLGELAQDLLAAGGRVLAGDIAEALKKDGMDCHRELPQRVGEAVLFDLAAKRDRVPLDSKGFNCWDSFVIQRPKRRAKRVGKSRGELAGKGSAQ
jgi:hypothetical protein